MKTKTIVQRRKSLSLKVEGDTLVIKRPIGLSDEVVAEFIERKKDWLKKQFQLQQVFQISFEEDLIVFNHPIKLIEVKSTQKKIIKKDNHWFVYGKNGLVLVKQELQELLLVFIYETLEELQKIKNFNVKEIKIKNLQSSWGNCNSKKQLSFAFRLVHMKKSFVKSVIAHEVSHLFVMNHSPSFYHVLSQFDPNYHSSIKDL